MPQMDGIEFIQMTKATNPDLKYTILTGFDITETINEALNSGLILNHFRKPFNIKETNSSIEKILN